MEADPVIIPRQGRGLHFAHLNVRSMLNKHDLLKIQLQQLQFDFFTFSESWLTNNITDAIVTTVPLSVCYGGAKPLGPWVRTSNFVPWRPASCRCWPLLCSPRGPAMLRSRRRRRLASWERRFWQNFGPSRLIWITPSRKHSGGEAGCLSLTRVSQASGTISCVIGSAADDDEVTARSLIGRMAAATLCRPISCSKVAAATRPSFVLGDSSASPVRRMSRPGVRGNDVTGAQPAQPVSFGLWILRCPTPAAPVIPLAAPGLRV